MCGSTKCDTLTQVVSAMHSYPIMSDHIKGTLVIYALLGLLVTIKIMMTQNEFPLFDFATWDIQWSNAWLWTSVVDFYGAALCFSAIIIATEKNSLHGLFWVILLCSLGSPVSCAYICYRCVYHRTLELSHSNGNGNGNVNGNSMRTYQTVDMNSSY